MPCAVCNSATGYLRWKMNLRNFRLMTIPKRAMKPGWKKASRSWRSSTPGAKAWTLCPAQAWAKLSATSRNSAFGWNISCSTAGWKSATTCRKRHPAIRGRQKKLAVRQFRKRRESQCHPFQHHRNRQGKRDQPLRLSGPCI